MTRCPLCQSQESQPFYQKVFKEKSTEFAGEYFYCPVCHLAYMAPQLRLSAAREKLRYETHNNDISQQGYRDFLNQLWLPLKEKLNIGMKGLDYGCGPTHALAQLAAEDGFELDVYDPFFYAKELAKNSYDFITCTEVAEHFYQPDEEFNKIKSLLKPGGVLAVMTDMFEDLKEFPNWYYHRDPTHVSFYQPKTFQWLSENKGWGVEVCSQRVVFLFKS